MFAATISPSPTPSHTTWTRAVARSSAVSSGRKDVGAPDEHAARSLEHAAFARRHHHRDQLVLKLLRVGMRLGVQDHEIGANALRSPIAVRHEQLADARQPRRRANRGEHDRPIAGNALRPERRLSACDGRALRFRGAKRLVRIDRAPRRAPDRAQRRPARCRGCAARLRPRCAPG